MRLTAGLLLYSCCLESFTHRGADACSIFANEICCSSQSTYQEFFRESSIRGYEKTMAGASVMNVTLPKSLRILCFGDSLTAGYTRYGYEHQPYADRLRAGLRYLLSTENIDVEVAGLSGDRVQGPMGQYLSRIKDKCPVDEQRQYDWIIVMGGTNDLGWGAEASEIYEGLSKIFRMFSGTLLVIIPTYRRWTWTTRRAHLRYGI